ncbi:MAG: Ig-like domain-containing protein, partial [Actinobacteria bacterium]|nr:Ig-like domain-containing protein [Actinomycetota bacterium]
VTLLADPARAGRLRDVLHLETNAGGTSPGQVADDTAEFTNPFQPDKDLPPPASMVAVKAAATRPGLADATDVMVDLKSPSGTTTRFDQANSPQLRLIAAGTSAKVETDYVVPVVSPKGNGESDADYRARLHTADTASLTATATVVASAVHPPTLPGPAAVVVSEHLPVLTLTKSGPDTADAGVVATYPLQVANQGGAAGSALLLTDALPAGAEATVTDVPATVAPGATATATATYAIPGLQPGGPLTDTAQLTWHDAKDNTYGPVSASFTTNVKQSVLFGTKLVLAPEMAGPDVVGTSQAVTATFTDSHGVPLADKGVVLTIAGPNATSITAITDSGGVAHFTYTGANDGTDQAQAAVTVGAATLQSNTASIGWITPIRPVSLTTVTGRFFKADTADKTFTAKPGDTPAFQQDFPTLAFNPPAGAVPHNLTGVDPSTRPFTDVTTDVAGNATGTIPAEGNGHKAGMGDLAAFDAEFEGRFTVAKPGDLTFTLWTSSGYVLGVGDGATRVNGDLENPPDKTPFRGMPVVSSFDQPGDASPPHVFTIHFPAAGTYSYELDYFACCDNPQQSLVLGTQSFTQDTSPLSVYVGYADGLRPAGSIFPFPWDGSPNVTFVGCTSACQFDAGTIRVDNNSDKPVTVNKLTVDFDKPDRSYTCTFDIWGADRTLPAHGIMIFTQLIDIDVAGCATDGSFDTSDVPDAYLCGQSGIVPKINLTVDGTTSSYNDVNQILNTDGQDANSCGGGNESRAWQRVGGPRPKPGRVFVTGHDPDFHATAGNQAGAQHIIQAGVRFVTFGVAQPRLLLVTDLRDPGSQYRDPRAGMTAAGYTYDVADYGSGTAGVLDLHGVDFSKYDAVVVASDYGGFLHQDELDILNARQADIAAYTASGGGLVA